MRAALARKSARDVVIEEFITSFAEELQPAVEKSRFHALESADVFLPDCPYSDPISTSPMTKSRT